MENLNKYHVEKLTIDDVQWVKDIYKQESKHIGTFNLFWTWDKYIDNSAPYKFVGFRNMAFVRFGYSKKLHHYVIYEIGVLKEFKRQGLAKRLVLSVAKIAHRQGSILYLKCNTDNEAANTFYESIGMRYLKKSQTRNGQAQNVWIL